MEAQDRKTPLFDDHTALGGKIVSFAGWQLPVSFEGLRQEHERVRNSVGLFDVSHMGEIRFRGPKALESLEWLTTNSVSRLNEGDAQYSLLPNQQGGLVDDVIVYCLKKNEDYLVCVNGANVEKDFLWMTEHNLGAEVTNESDQWGQIAIQGPMSAKLVGEVMGAEASGLKFFGCQWIDWEDEKLLVARTGYTGEDGFEVFVPWGATSTLWKALLKSGEAAPIGLGARDTLRTEMKFSLYGNEIDDQTIPLAAGLGWVVKHKEKDFLGREAMLAAKEAGFQQKLVGFIMKGKGIARHGYDVCLESGEKVGRVTSGTPSPTLNENIGIAYVPVDMSPPGSRFYVRVRNNLVAAEVVATPFVKTKGAP